MQEKSLQILYASQTGTTETEAGLLALQLRERNIPVKISSFDDYEIENLPEENFVLFLVATTGK